MLSHICMFVALAEAALFPTPLVGEGGRDEKHRGRISVERDPSSGADFVRATFSHKGRREERALTAHPSRLSSNLSSRSSPETPTPRAGRRACRPCPAPPRPGGHSGGIRRCR